MTKIGDDIDQRFDQQKWRKHYNVYISVDYGNGTESPCLSATDPEFPRFSENVGDLTEVVPIRWTEMRVS